MLFIAGLKYRREIYYINRFFIISLSFHVLFSSGLVKDNEKVLYDLPNFRQAASNSHIVYTVFSVQNVRLVQQRLSSVSSKNERLVCSVSIVYNVQNVSIVRETYLK